MEDAFIINNFLSINKIQSYSKEQEQNVYDLAWDKNEIKSEVESTLTLGGFFSLFSLDQRIAPNLRANAKYSGAITWSHSENIKSQVLALAIIAEKSTLASRTSNIFAAYFNLGYNLLYPSCNPLLIITTKSEAFLIKLLLKVWFERW